MLKNLCKLIKKWWKKWWKWVVGGLVLLWLWL